MRIRWVDILLAVGIAAWLGVFAVSCVPPFREAKSETAEKSPKKKGTEEPTLGTMERMEQQADQGELVPPAHATELPRMPAPQPHP